MKYFPLILIFFSTMLLAQTKKSFLKMNQSIDLVNLEYINNLPFIKVSINNKEYNFLVDTGALTFISTSIQKDLNLKVQSSSSIRDSQNNREIINNTFVSEIKIGKSSFYNIEAHIYDFKGFEFDCLNIDGIIGENLMALALWNIDYLKRNITITEDLNNFDLSTYFLKIPFSTDGQNTPLLPITIKNHVFNFKLDTGSNRGFSIDRNLISVKDSQKVNVKGISSIGAFNKSKISENYYFKLDTFEIGKKVFSDHIFMSGEKNLIGNKFLENFGVIIDWSNKYIYLKNEPIDFNKKSLDSFGFGYSFENNKPYIKLLFEDEGNLELGDEILSIEEMDFTNLSKENVCKYFQNDILKNKSKINISIKRNDNIKDFILEKKRYLE
ncbi:aspartyl protease family protein [Empedobacter falsenii]|uniref:Aspartyl protease family protein n=1 Tax=Empedobacter falsenii TaxID=343874 RepID=A0ABY8V557_9FLAO|nr:MULTISPECIES: aspartyl protease family protein [Empedobacter]MCA4781138.1 aspartyl protease family protein [Empedobacter stercoris]WIH96497.1 aspartyl protease family protein [Empedobacter falsenii]